MDEHEAAQGDSPVVDATAKSMTILRSLKTDGPATLTDLASRLGYSKSTVHRHLATLQREGYVAETDGEYRVGLLFLDYGIHAREESDLFRTARERVDDLSDRLDENVWLMVEENGHGVFIYQGAGKSPVRTFTREGYRAHLHTFAAGKVVLAHMDEERREQVLDRHGLPDQAPESITDREELAAELVDIRDRGVGFNRQESIRGINAVAAPVLDVDGRPLGSISVAGPASRLKGQYLEAELPELLLGVTNEIEVNLSYG
ncbi:IclR family transcriptional regulator [Halobacterium noricense]|uniref:IclR family transcriptional regulator n=1 Tax=Halobacterium noricense TaxID=223182 RepID=UPI001E3582C6|nr:IclR family transcriptional regulator [Halobacterium noricense]UHH24784.1 IclR family transcriptional regulator [Halobacterium noricense]